MNANTNDGKRRTIRQSVNDQSLEQQRLMLDYRTLLLKSIRNGMWTVAAVLIIMAVVAMMIMLLMISTQPRHGF